MIATVRAASAGVSAESDWLARALVCPVAPARRVRGAAAPDRARAAGRDPVAPARVAGQATVLAVAALLERAWLTRETWLFGANRPSIIRFHRCAFRAAERHAKFSTGPLHRAGTLL